MCQVTCRPCLDCSWVREGDAQLKVQPHGRHGLSRTDTWSMWKACPGGVRGGQEKGQRMCKGPVAGKGPGRRSRPSSAQTRIRSQPFQCQTPRTRKKDLNRSRAKAAFVRIAAHAHYLHQHAPATPTPAAFPEATPILAARAPEGQSAPPTSGPGILPPLRIMPANQGWRPDGGGACTNTKGQKPTQARAL